MSGVRWFERILNTVADRGRDLLGLRDGASDDSLASLCARLVAGRGEATNIALAREILQRFAALDVGAQTAFFMMLADEFAPDPAAIQAAAAAYEPGDPATLGRLIAAVEPPRQELFRRLNMAPQGTANLVDMRARLLAHLKDHPRLSAVDADFRHLLASWFNRGFLRLQRIDWRSPANVLERLMHHEAVHPMQGWDDLRRRLAADRRCFGFFHPALPEEPLVFVEVALTDAVASEIAPLIEPSAPERDPYAADTAVFYSINNALDGLRGISFGNFLLKQVLGELAAELPQLKQFVTLSPMPRFATGLRQLLDGRGAGWPVARLDAALTDLQPELLEASGAASPSAALASLIAHPVPDADAVTDAALARMALLYLAGLKQDNGLCYDPVAAFHLANGAILDRINLAADRSPKGLAQSLGLMVNYRYDPDQVVANHEAFVHAGRVVMSRPLQREYDKHFAGDD
ncbi:MAG: malonyl-CoA decarboxylase family protein [Chromatiaceae bacterium]|nr:malonyl-CoA decarboxylase family protein [Chromatiaceae bacterium]MCP5422609.1 malonyl-CoA decarboxylase family protein [Chromatiaceae bacterium]